MDYTKAKEIALNECTRRLPECFEENGQEEFNCLIEALFDWLKEKGLTFEQASFLLMREREALQELCARLPLDSR